MKKKVILVTGASKGIGKALISELLKGNVKIYGGMRTPDQQKLNQYFIPVYLDLTDEKSMISAVNLVIQKEGCIDVLYHVAGEAYYCPIEAITVEEMRHMYEVNLFGAFRLTQLVLPHMRKNLSGRIIFTSSVRSLAVCPFMGAYGGSKIALEAMAWDLKLTVNQWNIDIVVVQPGPVHSGIEIKSGSYFSELDPYAPPKAEDLQWQDLSSVSKVMAEIIDLKNPPFRVQTCSFAENMIEQSLKGFISVQSISEFSQR